MISLTFARLRLAFSLWGQWTIGAGRITWAEAWSTSCLLIQSPNDAWGWEP